MAKVEVVTEVVKFNLELSKEEASTLLDVLKRVGGNATTSRRKYSEAVLAALVDAGVESEQSDLPYGSLRFEQTLYDQTW